MNGRLFRFAALALVAAALAAARPLAAHGLHYPKRLDLRVAGGELRIGVDGDVEPGPDALAIRDRFDANADGALDAGERKALLDFLAARALRTLSVRYAGKPLALRETARRGYGDDESARASSLIGVHLDLVAPLPTAPRRGELLVEDSLPGGGHEVAADLAVEAPWTLAAGGAGQRSAASTAEVTIVKSIYLAAGKPARFTLVGAASAK